MQTETHICTCTQFLFMIVVMVTDQLYFGDHDYRNMPVYRGVGGHGGGSIEITAHYFELDGHVSANGEQAHETYSTYAGKGCFRHFYSCCC